jgi:hypothetical protein
VADFESILADVWRQALVDRAAHVTIDGEIYPVRHTLKKELRQVDFLFAERQIRGLEQNPKTKSRWAALARKGQKVMQFLEDGKYVAVVAEGKVHIYR